MSEFHVRTMQPGELAFAIDLAAKEGWNPGRHDAETFYAADPEGFFIGVLDGEPIGCISGVSYEGRFGFIGLYIVKPEHRGKGYGIQLWNAAMTRLKGHNIGLDGVVAQQANYQKSGFQFAFQNVRYRGVAKGHMSQGVPDVVITSAKGSLEAICNYDRRVFPEYRTKFLGIWLNQPDAGAFVAMSRGYVVGWAVIRPCLEGWKIGPLEADYLAIAQGLFTACCNHATAGSLIYLDIPMLRHAVQLAKTNGMEPVFETARMYTGQFPLVDLTRIFGVTTLEMG